jgi:hypothetical protein
MCFNFGEPWHKTKNVTPKCSPLPLWHSLERAGLLYPYGIAWSGRVSFTPIWRSLERAGLLYPYGIAWSGRVSFTLMA